MKEGTRYQNLLCLAVSLILGMNAVLSAGEVSGPQSGRWSLSGSPYIVTANIIVPAGSALTIEPGVVVKFAGSYGLRVEGTLTALGRPAERIVFTSANDNEFAPGRAASKTAPARKDWRGIEFAGSRGQLSIMEHCIVRYSETAISARFSQPELRQIILADCGASNLMINGKSVEVQDGIAYDYSTAAENAPAANAAILAGQTLQQTGKKATADEEEFSFGEITVVTASKREQKASDAPATVYVITEEMIKDRGYRNIEDLLDDIPGVEIQRKSVAEFSNYITFRGIAGNEKFVLLQDGFRFNSTTGTPHVVATNYALANAKRVEVVLGPASALYGVDAFSGIVNIITKTGEEINGGGLTGSFGRYSTTDNSFVIGKKLDQLAVSVAGQIYHSDEPDFPNIYKNEFKWYNEEYKTKGNMRLAPFLPNVIVKAPIFPYETPTNSYWLNAKLNYYGFEAGYATNSEAHANGFGNKPDYYIYAKEAKYQERIESMYLSHNVTSLDEKWSVQSSLSKGTYALNPESEFVNTFSSYKPAYKYAFSKTVKLEEQASFFPSEKTSLIGGFSYEDISALPKSGDLPFKFNPDESPDLQNIPYIGTDISDKNKRLLTIQQNFFNLQYKNYGSYLQLQSRLSDNAEVTVGGRYDYNTRYGSSINPRLGLVSSPSPKTKFKLLYGEAFLAPSPYKAYQHYGAFIPTTDSTGAVTGLFGPFWHLPNPDLKPEKMRSFEGSFSWYPAANIVFAVDGYRTRINDLITNVGKPNQVFEGIPVAFAEVPINKGTATITGGTLRIEGTSKTGATAINWHTAYSLTDGDLAGEVLPLAAKHTVKAGLELKYARFAVAPRLIYRSKSYHTTLNDANGNRLGSDAFAVINLFARYALTPAGKPLQSSVFLRVTNLTNQKYYNVGLAQDEGFAATPQDPLRLSGGVTLEF